ncbi:MAG: hypothetical protein CM1200mP13_01590 [Candidatus Pelagibacterales bacterium]|nr:MAG: hypothetical protein CM1200mP13_01590 [Pelagibacterales bacterium]
MLIALGNTNYDLIKKFFETYLGKFFIVEHLVFFFSSLCEIGHYFGIWIGFEIKTSNITGLLAKFGSVF